MTIYPWNLDMICSEELNEALMDISTCIYTLIFTFEYVLEIQLSYVVTPNLTLQIELSLASIIVIIISSRWPLSRVIKIFLPIILMASYLGIFDIKVKLNPSFICIVTGACSRKGVGRSTVFELAAHGVACVYACDLDDSNFDELIAECKEQYPSTEVILF